MTLNLLTEGASPLISQSGDRLIAISKCTDFKINRIVVDSLGTANVYYTIYEGNIDTQNETQLRTTVPVQRYRRSSVVRTGFVAIPGNPTETAIIAVLKVELATDTTRTIIPEQL